MWLAEGRKRIELWLRRRLILDMVIAEVEAIEVIVAHILVGGAMLMFKGYGNGGYDMNSKWKCMEFTADFMDI